MGWRVGPLPKITYSIKQTAHAVLAKSEKIMAPADSKEIAGHITLLLSHYYQDDGVSPAIAEGKATHWLEVLGKSPAWAIEKACIEYLAADAKGRKPLPGQIAALVAQETSKYTALMIQCRKIITAPIEEERVIKDDEMRARVSKIKEDVLKQLNRFGG